MSAKASALAAAAQDGGRYIGLRLALEAVTREIERETFRAGVARGAEDPRAQARHEYAAGVLTKLAAELAARFRA